VLFCDLVGSTPLSQQLDAEEWREVISRYQRAATEAVEKFGGHVAKNLGDGLLIYFGWPTAREDDRALLRRDGAAARVAAEAALASAAELIERTGAKTLAPALCEWRAELAAVLGENVTRVQLLRQAQQGYDEIGAPAQAERLRKELGS
jgi:class 3 adenylate cyclase